MLIILVSLITLLVVTYFLVNAFYPNLGGDVSKEKQRVYAQSPQYREGKFHNTNPNAPRNMSFGEMMSLAYKFFTTKVPEGRPQENLKVHKMDATNVANYQGPSRLVWYGHSAFLLQIEGKNILLDPMFGKVSAPHPFLGGNRFNEELPISIEELPQIDAVIFSHDHYDHLDYDSVMQLKEKTNHFFTPLGVGVHLEAWGILSKNITELDWWQDAYFEGLKLVCTPAQHFSGRKMDNGQSTLWSSWVIQSKEDNIYFSGDSGYAPHFKEIGDKYGPFDIALMECGQYNRLWSEIHMMPEETAQASVDVKAKKAMPIHWAGFKLALHGWKDPIERFEAQSKTLNLETVTPQIGEEILVKDSTKVYKQWWKNL
ncbi:MAG: MBL fold metallo-hydrolase [Flavobacteriales bacterium]|nr:MBL fold metallo-hydrolase [Flavobacteriales bacterium]